MILGPDVGQVRQANFVRRSLECSCAEAVTDCRGWTGKGGGGAGPSARGSESHAAEQLRVDMQNVQSVLSQQNADEQRRPDLGRQKRLPTLSYDQIAEADHYRPLVIGSTTGRQSGCPMWPRYSNGAQNIRTAGYLDGTPSITVIIFRQPGANIIETVDRVRQSCHRFRLPFLRASRSRWFWTARRRFAPRCTTWSVR